MNTSGSIQQYPYGAAFQDRVVALILREGSFLSQHAAHIRPEYFDSIHCQALVRIVLDWFFEHDGEIPTEATIRVQIVEETTQQPQLREELFQLVNRVYEADMTGISQTAETVVEFGRMRTMEAMIGQLIDNVKSGRDVDGMWELIDKVRADSSGSSIDDEMDLGASFMQAQEIAMASGLYNSKLKVATGIATLDTLFNGGVGRKEVAIALADTGRGKSTWLVNMGAAALVQQLPVIHFSVTELETTDLLVRYAARLTNCRVNDIANGLAGDVFKSRMASVESLYAPNIIAQRVAPGTSVSSLRSFISKFAFKRGAPPVLVIIDNTDDLTSGKKSREAYDELGWVYTELKDLAHDFDCAIWCDSQTNRTGSTVATIRGGQIGDSYKKLRKADICVSLNQTDEDLENGACRVATLKCRRAPRIQREIVCEMNAACMLIREAPGGGEVKAA